MADRKPTPQETAAFLAEMQRQNASSAGNPQFGSLGALTPLASLYIPQTANALIDFGQDIGNDIYNNQSKVLEHPGATLLDTLKLLLANPKIQAKLVNKATGIYTKRFPIKP